MAIKRLAADRMCLVEEFQGVGLVMGVRVGENSPLYALVLSFLGRHRSSGHSIAASMTRHSLMSGKGITWAITPQRELRCFGRGGWVQSTVADVVAVTINCPFKNVLYSLTSRGYVSSVREGDVLSTAATPTALVGAVASLACGVEHLCALSLEGTVQCLGGRNLHGECNVPAALGEIVAVAAAGFVTCLLDVSGQLTCFGQNQYGQCDVPPNSGPFRSMSTSGFHTCAVRRDGRLVCFGDNQRGQCDVPADLQDVRLVLAGGVNRTCAVTPSGELRCFGNNQAGQCDVPAGLGKVVDVATSLFHTSALTEEGELISFGDGALTYTPKMPECQDGSKARKMRRVSL